MIFKSKTKKMKKLEKENSELRACIQNFRRKCPNPCEVIDKCGVAEPMYYLRFEEALKFMLEGKTVQSEFNKGLYSFADGTFIAWLDFGNEWCVADMAGVLQLRRWRLME